MSRIEKSIEVDVPLDTVYNQWTQFEEFPRFMQGVKRVHQIDDKHLEWEAEIAGKDERWKAEITAQVPNKHIAWRSTAGAEHAGRVAFEPVDTGRTRVNVLIEYEPHGMTEKLGSALGMVGRRVDGDLEAFKTFIESRGRETGAWRGEIKGDRVNPTGRTEPPGVRPAQRDSSGTPAHHEAIDPSRGADRPSSTPRPGGPGPGRTM